MNKIGIIVPCFNDGERVCRFLQNFDEALLARVQEVLVINNASEDDTLNEVLKAKRSSQDLARQMTIINNKKNYGVGGSHKIAFDYFIERNFTHVLIIPSSYKGHAGKLASRFLNELEKHQGTQVIFGSRPFKSLNLKLKNKVVQKAAKKMAEPLDILISEYKFSDIGSRFTLISTEVLKETPYKSLSDSFGFHLQLNILLQEAGRYDIREIKLKTWVYANPYSKKQAFYSWQLLNTLYRFGLNKHILQKRGWRLFSDYPDNAKREFEIL